MASRTLDDAETHAFLDLVWSHLRLRRLSIRSLALPGAATIGPRLAPSSVVRTDDPTPPDKRYARLAHRSLRRARGAGAVVEPCASAEVFWRVYAGAARQWKMVYPESLVRCVVDSGAGRVHAVHLGERVVASLLTLVGGAHWMCWLAGQTAEGRSIAASYLAYDAVLAEARADGIPFVNLGASVGGGAEFKSHLGAVEVDLHQWRRESGAAAAARLARGSIASTIDFVSKRSG